MAPANLDGPVWYFTFGSSLNERLFRKWGRLSRAYSYLVREGARDSALRSDYVKMLHRVPPRQDGG